MATTEPASEQREVTIDVLRAVAVLLVCVQHFLELLVTTNHWGGPGAVQWAQATNRLDPGRLGVVLFFFVSGFVVPYSLRPDAPTRAHALKQFVVRRFFRLYPAYWLALPLTVAVVLRRFGGTLDPGQIAVNFTMLQSFVGVPDIAGHYWSLGIELGFYALCAGLFAGAALHRGPWVALAAVGLLLVHRLELAPPMLAQLCEFLPMPLAGLLLRRVADQTSQRFDRLALLVVAGFYLFGAPLQFALTLADGSGFPVSRAVFPNAAAMAIFVLGVFVFKWRSPGLAWLGRTSYAVYLLHPVVMYGLLGFYLDRCVPSLSLWGPALAFGGITILFSAAVHTGLELPMIARGRELARRIGAAAPPPSTPPPSPSRPASRWVVRWVAGLAAVLFLWRGLPVLARWWPEVGPVCDVPPLQQRQFSAGQLLAQQPGGFPTGWSFFEGEGVWAVGERTELRLSAALFGQPRKLRLQGWYFGTRTESEVTINEVPLGRLKLNETVVTLPPEVWGHGRRELHIVLGHPGPQSPAQAGLSADSRELAFFLDGILFEE